MKNNVKLSIIIPIYNAEKYIIPCLNAVFKQGLDESSFEVILVNDGTKDKSFLVINEIIKSHNNIIILEQENQGQAVARNNGLKVANGQYIMMIDSDDLLVENSLSPLLTVAVDKRPDLLVANFLTKSDVEMTVDYHPNRNLEIIEKTGKELFIEDLNPHECFIWRTLYSRDFLKFNNICFFPGTSPYEDIPFTHECYLKARKCLKTDWIIYIYRRGQESSTFTKFTEKRAKEFCFAIAKTWALKYVTDLDEKAVKKIVDDVYTSFSVLMSLTCTSLDKNEISRVYLYLRQQIPDLFFNNGLKQYVISFVMKRYPFLFIRVRLLYAIIFEKKWMLHYYYRIRYKVLSYCLR